jgi:hypothetical protein
MEERRLEVDDQSTLGVQWKREDQRWTTTHLWECKRREKWTIDRLYE